MSIFIDLILNTTEGKNFKQLIIQIYRHLLSGICIIAWMWVKNLY